LFFFPEMWLVMSSGFALEWLFQRAANKNILPNIFPERSLKAHKHDCLKAHEQYPQKHFSKQSFKAHKHDWLKEQGLCRFGLSLARSSQARTRLVVSGVCCERGLLCAPLSRLKTFFRNEVSRTIRLSE